MKLRFSHNERRTKILSAAIPLAIESGYQNLTRDAVACAAQIAGSTLMYHFTSMTKFKEALLLHALETRCLEVIAQAVVARDPAVAGIPTALKNRALAAIK